MNPVFAAYKTILSRPGAWQFSLAGFLARYPMALVGLSTILMLQILYDSYSLAGRAAGVNIVSYAVMAPYLARWTDKYGQAKVMRPCIAISGLALIALIVAAVNHAPEWIILTATAVSGGFSGSLGSMVRARWSHILDNPSHLRTAFAMEAGIDEVAFMTGPVLATGATTLIHPAAGLGLALFFIFGGGFWFMSQRQTEPPPRKPEPPQDSQEETPEGKKPRKVRTRSVMLTPVMFVMGFVFIVGGALFGISDLSIVAFATEEGSRPSAGIILAVYATGSLISAFLYGAYPWRLSLWKLFAIGILLLAIGNSLFVFATSIPMLMIIVFLTGFSISPTTANVSAIVQQTVEPGRLTEGLTWMSTCMNVGVSVGSAIGGVVVDHGGSAAGFRTLIIAAWSTVFVMLLGLRVLKKADQDSRPRLNPPEDKKDIAEGDTSNA
ncbi:MAG: MFS transporter [Actinomycetaceae bacterium]|nr:MFS transporter [Actinomycetaceae bacterium]